MRRRRLAFLLLSILGSCDRLRGSPVDVAPISAEDDTISRKETDLLGRRGDLLRERKKITDERAELVERRRQLGHDSAGQAALDAEEQKLVARESALVGEESKLDDKIDGLIKLRAELMRKATQAVATAPGADPLERAARREQGVAQREKDVSLREAELAEREQKLAEREARQGRREKETCGAAALPPPSAHGLKYSAHDVEPVYKRALKLMQERGLLASDLPPVESKLVDETRDAMKHGDYVRAKYDADQLLAAVEEIKIDRTFISAKMARLSGAMRGKKLEGGERKSVEELFQDATANYGDGKFTQANAKINKLFTVLK